MKAHDLILLIMIVAIGAFNIYSNVRIDKKFVRTNALIEDARLLLFASLEDVDTLVYPDRFIIFDRGFDSHKLFINTLLDDSTQLVRTPIYWNAANQTVADAMDPNPAYKVMNNIIEDTTNY